MTTTTVSRPPVEKRLGTTLVRIEQGDLTTLAVDAVVYYARESLELASGHGTAIQSRGGGAVKKELEKIGGVRMGEAVITTGGALKAKHIIHACGPKFQEPETERKLRECMRSALKLAADHGLKTVAFPAMGAGFYGVPLPLCARVMLETIRESTIEQAIVCVVDKREFTAFEAGLAAL